MAKYTVFLSREHNKSMNHTFDIDAVSMEVAESVALDLMAGMTDEDLDHTTSDDSSDCVTGVEEIADEDEEDGD